MDAADGLIAWFAQVAAPLDRPLIAIVWLVGVVTLGVVTVLIFAIPGLRALYFALAAMTHRFQYLKPALAIVLIFIGSKIFVADLLGLEKFPAALLLGVTFAIIASGVVWSLVKTRSQPPNVGPEELLRP